MLNRFHSKPDLIVHSARPPDAEPSTGRRGCGLATGRSDLQMRGRGDTAIRSAW